MINSKMNTLPKYIAYTMLSILGMVFLSFLYFGITTLTPTSNDYNIPVAQSIVSGEFLHKQVGVYIHSPGSSHSILAFFIAAGIPLNLYGLLSWIVLFILCKKLADTFNLNTFMGIIFAASICTTISVIRTIGDQSIDKWLCSWFVLSMILLEKPKRTLGYSALLGFSLGMLIGTKYSGPLFFIALIPIYWKSIFKFLSPLRFTIMTITFTVFGLFWYIRNWIYEGNPYYPANLFFFKGIPNFHQQDCMLWIIPFQYPQNIIPLINSFISEYLIWAFSGIIIIWYFISIYRKKKPLDATIKRLGFLGLTIGLVSLLLPITPPYKIELFHIISDMRYIYILMVVLMLAVFLIANKYKQNNLLSIIALLSSIPLFSFLPYQPKTFIFCIIVFIVLYYLKPKMIQKIIANLSKKQVRLFNKFKYKRIAKLFYKK
jgi:hypothetical protein